ncbi:zinc finger BED domain-containing protein DAYSLEEPER-like [Humulus lupulus]|uniref:zinc finger BED domain-containing protein DAYSLEEPER-like n=1 Tax=Humulus lupulus TaxID=3486 RepID=UPI002B40D57C|nr:zinc finger BED domain-containing protein DAYSLEEPER-like [Humulus lupulus]
MHLFWILLITFTFSRLSLTEQSSSDPSPPSSSPLFSFKVQTFNLLSSSLCSRLSQNKPISSFFLSSVLFQSPLLTSSLAATSQIPIPAQTNGPTITTTHDDSAAATRPSHKTSRPRPTRLHCFTSSSRTRRRAAATYQERKKENVQNKRNDRQNQDKEKDKETEKEDNEKEKEKEVERPEKKQRVGKKTSSVWDHYTMLPDCDPKKPRTAYNYCGTDYAAETKLNGTSTLWAHVERKCKKCPFSDWVEQSKKQQSTMDRFTKKTTTCNEEEVSSSGIPLRFNQNVVRKVIAEYIIMDELSFRHVDGKGFQKLIKHFFPTFQFLSRFTVARDIYNVFLDQKKELKSIFVKHRVSLTTDFFAVTVDNASSNDIALRKLKRHLLDKDNTIPLNGKMFHMRCSAHILNLIVTDGLKELNDAISIIQNVVRYVRSSPARLKRCKESCKDANIESKALLCLDVVTRWNSTYLMLESAIKFKKAFENLEEDANYTKYFDEEIMDGPPTNLDWEKAVVFVDFLRRFYDLANRFSGSLYVTSNLFLPDILKVQADLTTMASNPDTLLGAMAVSMKRKYDKYWGRIEKLNMLTFIANIFDPRYKLEVVNRGFKFVYTSSEAEKMIKLVTYTLAQLYAFYKQQQPSQSS